MDLELMGIAEIRTLLDISRQRADQLIRRTDFPPPLAVLAMGKVWDGSAVRDWARKDGRL